MTDRQSLSFNMVLLKKKTFIENVEEIEENTGYSIDIFYGITDIML